MRPWFNFLGESLEQRVFLSGDPNPPDLSPLSIPNLVFQNGAFTATNPTISVNGQPTLSLQGSVSVANNQITAMGQVSAAFGGNQLLFGGNFTIPVGTAATTALADTLGAAANRLQLGGTSLQFQNLTLGAASVNFNAKAKLPAALGSFELNATGVQLGASGISAATIGVNDPNTYMFDLGGFKLNAQSLSATYDVSGQKVKLNGLFNAPQLNTTVDLSGNKFLAIGAGPSIEFAGGVSIAGPVNIGGPWKLNSLDLQVIYQNNDFTTTGNGVVDTGGGNLNISAAFANNTFSFSAAGAASFNVLGMTFTLSSLTFTSDQSNGGSWDPKIAAQGSLKLPDQFGGFTIAIDQSNQLTVDSTGVSVTGGTVSLPADQTFNVLSLLRIKTKTDAKLSFDFTNNEAKLQGTFIVPTLNNLEINLSGANFAALKLDNGSLDFAMMGSFNNLNIPIYQQWALQNGSVTINKPYGTSPGDISGSFQIKTPNNTTITLSAAFLDGRLDQVTATNNNPNPDFTFYGVSASLKKVKFIPDTTPGNEDDFEPQLELQGSVSLPTSFGTTNGGGKVTFEVVDPEKFILNETSITLTGGSISIPAVDFNLLGLVKVSAQSLKVQFISTPEPAALRISGIVKIPQLYNLTLDFDPTKNRFLKIDSGGNVTVNGVVSVENVAIVPNVWVIKKATFAFNNSGPQSIFEVSADLKIPSGVVVGGKIKFVGGNLDAISLTADNIRVPLGATGIFLTRIGGGLQNLASPAALKFTGTLGLSFGPRIDFTLPGILGGAQIGGALVDMTVDGSIDKNSLHVNGRMAIIGNSRPQTPTGLVTGTAVLDLNWKQGLFKGTMTISALDGVFSGTVNAQANKTGSFSFQGNVMASLPNALPYPVGGTSLGSADGSLYYANNNTFSDDFISVIGTLDLGLTTVTRGVQVFFDGRHEIIDSAVPVPPLPQGPATDSFELTQQGRDYFAQINWTNGIAAVQTQIQHYNPQTQQFTDVTAGNNAFLGPVTFGANGAAKRTILLKNVKIPGTYFVSVFPPAGQTFANISFQCDLLNVAPAINLTSATVAPAPNLADVTINYNATDPDDIAKITWFVDQTGAGFNGQQIQVYFNNAKGFTSDELDGNGSVVWKAAERAGSYGGQAFATGDYFIYARITDDNNQPVFRYLPGSVHIDTNELPHQIGVRVDSTKWNAAFKTRLQQLGLASADYYDGVILSNGPGALAQQPLPWSNIDTVIVQLSKEIVLPEVDPVTLLGISTANYPVQVEYDPFYIHLAITVPNAAAAERLLLKLSANIVSDEDPAKPFDGNNDGVPGDDAELRYNVLHGDVNRDGAVNIADFATLANGFLATAAQSSSSGYSPLADFDGSGAINIFDFAILAANFGRGLPNLPPATELATATRSLRMTGVFNASTIFERTDRDSILPDALQSSDERWN